MDFEQINNGYNSVFKQNELSIGVVVPIENYSQSAIPTMKNHLEKVKLIEQLVFKSLWLRDVPFNVPSFGDAGQIYDPFTYAGFLAGQTSKIALGISSIALPLHHPIHVAKSAATIDQLSNGRLILGVASGDRFDEYPSMGFDYDKRSQQFREAFTYIRNVNDDFPTFKTNFYGELKGNVDALPKSHANKIPLLMTGFSQQTLEWNVQNTDGWMYYPRNLYQQKQLITNWRDLIKESQPFNKPFMQPLYIDLQEDDDFKPQPIHLGFKLGTNYLVEYLNQLKEIGVNHVALNLRFNAMNTEKTLKYLSEKVLTHFHKNN